MLSKISITLGRNSVGYSNVSYCFKAPNGEMGKEEKSLPLGGHRHGATKELREEFLTFFTSLETSAFAVLRKVSPNMSLKGYGKKKNLIFSFVPQRQKMKH